MGNIVGEDHLQYVKTQIKDRQTILGKNIKSNEDIVWANNKGGWCRLMSSINIADEEILRFNPDTNETKLVFNSGSEFRNQYLGLQDYGGPMLAQELILQGGILNYDAPKFGISDSTSNLPGENSNYGYGGTEFGLNAMPGLLGFTSKTYDNGSLRKATIKIKANNKKQFEYLESTYIRLGYTMLLEWGNTTFPLQETNDEGTSFRRYSTTGDNAALSLKDEFIYSYNKGQNYFHTRIEELRRESQGNYDGFLGMVDNFNWEFQKDGSYLITLSLITIGSVIQSLKGNLTLESVQYPNLNNDSSSTPEEDRPTALEVAVDILSQANIVESTTDVSRNLLSFLPNQIPTFQIKLDYELIPIKIKLSAKEEKSIGISNDILNNGFNPDTPPVISCNAAFGQDAFNVQQYLRFGTLLEFINQKLLLYDNELNPTHITIDTSPATYCYSNGWSFPSDPEKMIISYDKKIGDKELKVFSTPETQISKFHTTITDKSSRTINVGEVMNLYFNRDYIKSLIRQYTDDEKGLSIYKFIEAFLNTTNSQLGNVNKLKLRVTNKKFNETVIKQVLEIYDEVAFIETPADSSFIVYGFDDKHIEPSNPFVQQEGSFVTDLSIKTNIDKNLASTIAIGAQAGGRAVGYDSLVCSKWNVGLVDRIIPSKLDIVKAKKETLKKRNDWTFLQVTYIDYLLKLQNTKIGNLKSDSEDNVFLRQITNNLKGDFTGYIIPNIFLSGNKDKQPTFSRFSSIQSNFFNQVLAWDAERKNTVTPFQGFLPINLSLTIDGLSGIKIFDKLTVDSRFLPKSYTDTLNFVITELDHAFENNKWVTKLGTLSIPKLFPENLPTVPLNKSVTPTDVAEVPGQIEDVIQEEIESTPVLRESNRRFSELYPSYFAIKAKTYRGVGKTGAIPENATRRIERNEISEILGLLNISPAVQSRFRKFFLQILDTYPKGYAFTINDATRSLGSNTSTVGTGSAHQYGLAIDMGIREAYPKGEEPKNPEASNQLYQSKRIEANAIAIRKFGLPDIAYENGLIWGGDYTKGYVFDVVHFAVAPKWSTFSPLIKQKLYNKLSLLEGKLKQSPTSFLVRNNLRLINTQNFVILSFDPKTGNPKYEINAGRILFGGNSKGQVGLKKFIGYNS